MSGRGRRFSVEDKIIFLVFLIASGVGALFTAMGAIAFWVMVFGIALIGGIIGLWVMQQRRMAAEEERKAAEKAYETRRMELTKKWVHRIRYALRDPVFADIGEGGGTVEADETYVGGKPRKQAGRPPVKRGRGTKKIPVVALVERGGRVRSRVVKNVTAKTLDAALAEHVDPSAHLMTDDWKAYRKPGRRFASHSVVNHTAGEYARGNAHTASA